MKATEVRGVAGKLFRKLMTLMLKKPCRVWL